MPPLPFEFKMVQKEEKLTTEMRGQSSHQRRWRSQVERLQAAESVRKSAPKRHWYKMSKFPPLSVTHPRIAKQWHPSKNGPWRPDEFTYGSGIAVWWCCPVADDHVWKGSICGRTKSKGSGYGCPFCAGLKVSKTNCLKVLYPQLSREWHPTKNGKITPDKVVAGSHKKAWWKCRKGKDHEWKTPIKNRSMAGNDCPFCRSYFTSVTNSLATTQPKLARLWHPTKNGSLTPAQIPARSGHRVWWKCPKGKDHEWQASPGTKIANKSGCPFCAGVLVSRTNSLGSLYPVLAKQWHKTKNGKLKPFDLVAGSNKKVWWQCNQGKDHVWKGAPADRIKSVGDSWGCPYCSGKRTSKEQSFAALHPFLARQWHKKLNRPLTPKEVLPMSCKLVWWQCPEDADHIWQAPVGDRTRARGCPHCSKEKRIREHSLATRFPEVAAEFHPSKNGGLSPDAIMASSRLRVWWRCRFKDKHVWQVSVQHRTGNAGRCPYCASSTPRETSGTKMLLPLSDK
jgi:Probable Zinc-ribbon domain